MNEAKQSHEWEKYLKFFSAQNAGRMTRLGVFESHDHVVNDYWLESGLPFVGIDIDARGERPSVQVTVGHYTHDASNVVKLEFKLSLSGEEDGIDITDVEGRTTILRFETRPAVA